MGSINSDNIRKMEHILSESATPVIVTHMKPDGDALGSSTAMYHYLRMAGKSPKIVLNDRYPEYLSFLVDGKIPDEDLLQYDKSPFSAGKAIAAADLIICLDFNAFHRTDMLEKHLAEATCRKILIDHHLSPDQECFDLVFSETEVSSASELLYQVMMETSRIAGDAERLPLDCATAILTGMTTDTNNFANSVYPSTLSMTSALLQRGVDRDAVLDLLYNRHSENRLRLMGHMMKDLLTITDDGVAYIVLDRHTQMKYSVAEGDTEGFVNMPLSIGKVRMSILAKEDGGRIRISIRSKKGTSANRCAREHFNGGGHENAAGGRLFMPDNVSGTDQIGKYIEEHTHEFLTEKDEDNK